MKIKYLIIISILLASTGHLQIKDYDLGTPNIYNRNYNAGYYDYSDLFSINFKVSVRGYV